MPNNRDSILMHPTTHTCQATSGREIRYYDYGGSGPTILFAHAASFHGRIWDQTISQLTHNFRCVTFDFGGHGSSSGSRTKPCSHSQAWTSLFSDISDVTDQLQVKGPLFGVGHSLGATGLTYSQVEHPNLFDALWLYEPVIFKPSVFFGPLCEKMASAAEGRKPCFDSAEEAVDNFSPRPPFNNVDPDVLTDYVKYGFVSDNNQIWLRCSPETEAATYRNGADLDIFDRTSEISVATRIISGSIDPRAADFGQELSDNIRSASHVTLEGISHLGPLEKPARIASSISGFLS